MDASVFWSERTFCAPSIQRGTTRCMLDSVSAPKTDGISWSLEDFHWPMVVNRSLAKEMTDAQLVAALAAMDSVLNTRQGKFSLVHDYTGFERFTAKQRQMVAEHSKANKLRTTQRCLGIAFVFDSALLRGVLTAVHWVYRSPTRTKVFGNAEDARTWARSLHYGLSSATADRQGESVPPSSMGNAS